MNVNQENLDELNAIIKIQIEPDDYKKKVEDVLKDYRKKATLDGFRPGKAPLGIIKKLYGTSALVEQVNQLLGDKLNEHISENKLRILGEPLPNENSPSIDWEKQESFDFAFDIAIAPEIELSLSKKDKVIQYVIEADDKIINEQIENFSQRFGAYKPIEKAEEKDMMKGDFIQLDEKGEPILDGLRVEDALISISTISNDEVKKQFIGASVNQDIIFDPNSAFPNDADRGALFKMKRDDLEQIKGQFKYSVGEITRFTEAEVNQKLFDQTYGEGSIKSLEEFKERIKKDLEMQFVNEGSYKFHIDAREKLLQKGKFDLPDDFLKRWMLATTEDKNLTREKIEEDYPSFQDDLRWQLIKGKFVEEQEIKVEADEIKSYAVQDARNRFAQYGMHDVPDEQLVGLAE